MNEAFHYTVSRFGVSSDTETLLEHAELVLVDTSLVLRVDGQPDRTLTTQDVATAIAEEPMLSEVRANQVTRIKAGGVALDLLPFGLSVPGDPDDFDQTQWSKALADQHTHQEWVVQPGRCRVAYVNEARWCPWPTVEGLRMLPEHWPTVALSPTWARLTFSELAGMTSGQDNMTLGLVTPCVAVACSHPDSGSLKVAVWRREVGGDAEILVQWLLDWVPRSYTADEGFKALLVQLFVEAACLGRNGSRLSGARLTAGWGTSLGFGDTDTSEWALELNAPGAAEALALDLISQRDEHLAGIVAAARDPQSPQGQARARAVEDWEHHRADESDAADEDDEPEYEEAEDSEDDGYDEPDQYDGDLTAPWNRSPQSRMPKAITPGEIPIQFWRRYERRGRPVASDFVFTWGGGRSATWRYSLSPDNPEPPDLATRWLASFHGTAAWPDGINVELTYSSPELGLSGDTTLRDTAPTFMDPTSPEQLKRPGIWVELAGGIVRLLNKLAT